MPELFDVGLVLQAVIPEVELPESVASIVADLEARPAAPLNLVMLAQAGTAFWEATVRHELHRDDPFDEASVEAVDGWFRSAHPDGWYTQLYPGPAPLPLGRLAELVGWGSASPLGLSIHPVYGLWTAHRIVFATDVGFETLGWEPGRKAQPHPCDTCVDRPCESACPVGAVSARRGFAIGACATHRIGEGSVCAYQCLARNACPVGAEYRYGGQQMRHHYGAGLASIQAWESGSATEPES